MGGVNRGQASSAVMSELRGDCWRNPIGHWLLGLLRHHLHHLLTEGCGGDCEHTHTHTITHDVK